MKRVYVIFCNDNPHMAYMKKSTADKDLKKKLAEEEAVACAADGKSRCPMYWHIHAIPLTTNGHAKVPARFAREEDD